VLIDLRDVEFVDSSGLKFLLRTKALADRSGWTLRLYSPADTAMKAFVVTGADNWLPFIDADGTATEPPSGDEPVITVVS
jgi:anti-anti-sigma factor